MPKIAIIHSATATVDPLKALAAELIPDAEVVNFVDDSILPQLLSNGANVAEVAPRVVHYARFAESVGADVILEACSSIGEVVNQAQQEVHIPIVRIDDAMAEQAVTRGTRIGVVATIVTTLAPTTRLIEAKAAAHGKAIVIVPLLIADALNKLLTGDREAHDTLLVDAISQLAPTVDVVVLAQGSMARVIPLLPAAVADKCLTSPRLGMERVKAVLTNTKRTKDQ